MSTTNVRDDQLPAGAGSAADVEPVPAASVLLLRESPVEVLLLRRHEKSSFVPNTWVFPGGVSEPADAQLAASLGDDSELAVMRVAAMRELFEEIGIWLGTPMGDMAAKRSALLGRETVELPLTLRDLEKLVWTARWVTPVGVPRRFDTWFFLARADSDAAPSVEENEAVELRWLPPLQALEMHARNELPMVFPTLKNLEAIAQYGSVDELLAARSGATVSTTRPRLVIEGGQKKIVLPD